MRIVHLLSCRIICASVQTAVTVGVKSALDEGKLEFGLADNSVYALRDDLLKASTSGWSFVNVHKKIRDIGYTGKGSVECNGVEVKFVCHAFRGMGTFSVTIPRRDIEFPGMYDSVFGRSNGFKLNPEIPQECPKPSSLVGTGNVMQYTVKHYCRKAYSLLLELRPNDFLHDPNENVLIVKNILRPGYEVRYAGAAEPRKWVVPVGESLIAAIGEKGYAELRRLDTVRKHGKDGPHFSVKRLQKDFFFCAKSKHETEPRDVFKGNMFNGLPMMQDRNVVCGQLQSNREALEKHGFLKRN